MKVNFVSETSSRPRLAYVDAGAPGGRPVVLMHSLGTDHLMWGPVAQRIGAQCRLIIPDARGHGMSGWVSGSELSVSDWVTDLTAVLDHANVRTACVAGLSMGGVQALAMAIDRPDRVSGILVADSFAQLAEDVAAARIESLTVQALGGMSQLAVDYLSATLTADPEELGTTVGDLRHAIAGVPVEAYIGSVQACFGVRLAGRIRKISCPSLILWGERDQKTPRDLSEFLAAGIPDARFRVLTHAGHLSAVENPASFSDAVLEVCQGAYGENEGEPI